MPRPVWRSAAAGQNRCKCSSPISRLAGVRNETTYEIRVTNPDAVSDRDVRIDSRNMPPQ